MAEQMERIGLALDTPPVELLPAIRPGDKGEWPSIGARGCFMSHLKAIQMAETSNLTSFAIVEDDANWTPMFLNTAPEEVASWKSGNWEFMHGGRHQLERTNRNTQLVQLRENESILTTHFIGLRGRAIKLASNYLSAMATRAGGDPAGGPMHVDGAYNWFRRSNPDVVSVMCRPGTAYQRSSKTDIHDLKLIDRIKVMSKPLSWLRRQRNQIRDGLD
ncbi:MAG: hypothetical protein ABJQ63_10295 [Lentilitoribacter sp.]